MVALTLSGSVGFSLHKMICLHSGKQKVSFSAVDCCSANNTQKETFRNKCCEFEVFSLSLNDFAPLKEFVIKDHVSFSIDGFKRTRTDLRAYDVHFQLFDQNLPPPILHKNIQVQFQSFLC